MVNITVIRPIDTITTASEKPPTTNNNASADSNTQAEKSSFIQPVGSSETNVEIIHAKQQPTVVNSELLPYMDMPDGMEPGNNDAVADPININIPPDTPPNNSSPEPEREVNSSFPDAAADDRREAESQAEPIMTEKVCILCNA